MTVVPLGPDAGRAVLRALADNEIVCLLCDRDIEGGGVEVEFFGERTTLPAGPATLALRTGAPVAARRRLLHPPAQRPPRRSSARRCPPSAAAGCATTSPGCTQDLAHELECLIRRAPVAVAPVPAELAQRPRLPPLTRNDAPFRHRPAHRLHNRCSPRHLAPSAPGDPLNRPRITLAGRVVQPEGEAAEAALDAHVAAIPGARLYSGWDDFSLWILEVERVRWVGGFARMDTVSREEYYPPAEGRRECQGGGMGFYGERVLPRIINVACGLKGAEPLRRRVCAGLEGEVVEIGFGSGLNVPFYPGAVTRVAAVEPADVGWKLAEKRVKATSVAVPAIRPGRPVAALRR